MKRFIGNLRMSTKLAIAPLIAMLLLMVLAAVSYKGLSEQKLAIDDLTNVRFKAYQDASEMIIKMTTAHKDVFKLLSFADMGTEESKIEALTKECLQSIEQLKAFVDTAAKSGHLRPEEQTFFLSSLKEIEDYEAAVKKIFRMASADVSMALTMMAPLEDRFQELHKKMAELLSYETKLSAERRDESLASYQFVLRSFGVVVVAAVLLSVLTIVLMVRTVTSSIKDAMKVIQTITEGDLTQEVHATTRDEIGRLVRSVDAMRAKMAEAVGQSVSMSLHLSDAASRQAAALEETSSSVEEMASMTHQNAANTKQANQLMTEAEEMVQVANGSMTGLTRSMKEIADSTEQTRKIIKTIDEIAFQTNLLALNAAVEAARAGEAGAGFAVVADEVRNLAMRAAESARGTSSLTEDIVNKVKKGEGLVSETYEAFQAVTERSSKVVKLVAEVAAASEEQSQGVGQINQAVADMNSLTQQNAASAEELASAMAMFRVKESSGAAPRRHQTETGTPVQVEYAEPSSTSATLVRKLIHRFS